MDVTLETGVSTRQSIAWIVLGVDEEGKKSGLTTGSLGEGAMT